MGHMAGASHGPKVDFMHCDTTVRSNPEIPHLGNK